MVRIYRGEILFREIEKFDLKEIFGCIKKNPDMCDMCFVLHNKGKIVGAVSALDFIYKRDFDTICYEIDGDIFVKARDYYYNGGKKNTLIPILDSSGKLDFILYFQENKINIWGEYNFRKYDDYDLIRDKEILDYTIIEKPDCFVFYELEEYTFALTNLILERYPEKKIIYIDDNITYFYDSSFLTVVNSIYNVYDIIGECLTAYIRSNIGYCGTVNFPQILSRDYSSIQLINSLVWCIKTKEFGELNSDKTILLIDYPAKTGGLGDIMKFTAVYKLIAQEKNWLFAVNLNTYPNQYLMSENDNMWEYYFQDISDISLEEVYKSKNVISARDNNILMDQKFENILYDDKIEGITDNITGTGIDKRISGKILLNSYTIKWINENLPEEILNKKKRIMGLIVRGTDYKAENVRKLGRRHIKPDLDIIVAKAKYLMEIYECDYIFVATEDEEYFKVLKNSFEDKVLYVNQKRFNIDGSEKYKYLAEEVEKLSNPKEFGYDYLTSVYGLSKCDVLLSSTLCGAYFMAKYFNEGNYEYAECIKRITVC